MYMQMLPHGQRRGGQKAFSLSLVCSFLRQNDSPNFPQSPLICLWRPGTKQVHLWGPKPIASRPNLPNALQDYIFTLSA